MATVAGRRLGSILRDGRSAPSGRQPENRPPVMRARSLGLAGPGSGSTVLVRRHCLWRRARWERGRPPGPERKREHHVPARLAQVSGSETTWAGPGHSRTCGTRSLLARELGAELSALMEEPLAGLPRFRAVVTG